MYHTKKSELIDNMLVFITEQLSGKPFAETDGEVKAKVCILLDQLYTAGVQQGKLDAYNQQRLESRKNEEITEETQEKIVEWIMSKTTKETSEK